MYEQLKGKGVIAFSDPAVAKAGLALAVILKEKYKLQVTVISNKVYDFYPDWPIDVMITDSATFDFNALSFETNWVFTGTSHPDSSGGFELSILLKAKEKNIPSWAFVEHWTNIKTRFEYGSTLVLPDKILVLNEFAKQEAIKQELPAERIEIFPNPYLLYIREYWESKWSKQDLLQHLGIENKGLKLVLYAPDPISLGNRYEHWTFNELTVFKELLTICDQQSNVALLVKRHPLQPENGWKEVLEETGDRTFPVVFVKGIDNLELIHQVDLVIGFHSNLLLEAQALDPTLPIIRYYPASGELDPISHLEIGQKITSILELTQRIAKITHKI